MTTTNTTPDLTTIPAVAATVGAEYDAARAAHDAELHAVFELWRAFIAAARPALRAIASRPKIDSDGTLADVAGIHVCGDKRVASETWRNGREQNRGVYSGAGLYVDPDGSFFDLTYSGEWSRWQGESSEWTATVATYSTIEDVEKAWAISPSLVEGWISALAEQIAAAQGTRAKATAAATARAERLVALATLLRGGK